MNEQNRSNAKDVQTMLTYTFKRYSLIRCWAQRNSNCTERDHMQTIGEWYNWSSKTKWHRHIKQHKLVIKLLTELSRQTSHWEWARQNWFFFSAVTSINDNSQFVFTLRASVCTLWIRKPIAFNDSAKFVDFFYRLQW